MYGLIAILVNVVIVLLLLGAIVLIGRLLGMLLS